MLDYFSSKGQHLVQTVLNLPEPLVERGLKVTAALAVITLLGFGTYYYFDHYYRPVEPVTGQVLRHLEAQVIQDPQNPDARVQVGWAYLDLGMFEQAITQFNEALKLRAEYQAALIGKGTAYMRKGDLNAARGPFERVADLNKDNPFRHTLRELQAVYYYLGTIYAKQAEDDEAISAFGEALSIDRADADSLYGLGMVYLRRGDLEQARPLLEQAVRLDPVFVDGYRALKTVYEKQGMVGHALLVKGMLSFARGDYDNALSPLQQAVALLPDLPEAHQALGMVYEKKGQQAEALLAFQTALEKDPRLPLAQAGVARLNR